MTTPRLQTPQRAPTLPRHERDFARTALATSLTLIIAAGALGLPGPGQAEPAPVGPPSFADIAEQVTAAVVNVTVVQQASGADALTRMLPRGLPDGSPLQEFFKRFHAEPQFGVPREGQGSGFIIDPDGYIVTNSHVVEQADKIEVTLIDGRQFEARVIGRDTKTDVALLKIDADGPLPAVELGSAERARVGDWVLAVGNPFGLGGSVSAGIISARGRDIQSGPYDDYLQIDAPINRGNSGGPLFDATGKVIGVNTAIYSPSGGNIGIGFAIPAETVASVVADLRATGRVERGWLGIQIQSVSKEVAASLGLNDTRGVLVADVLPDGPAKAAGLRAGDVILGVSGQPMTEARDLTRFVADLKAGAQVPIEVLRAGKRERIEVTIGSMPNTEVALATPQASAGGQPRIGVFLAALTPEYRTQFGLSADAAGVLVTSVEPGSPAARAGIEPGDLISMVGQQPVTTPDEVAARIGEAIAERRPAVLLRVENQDAARFVAVPFDD